MLFISVLQLLPLFKLKSLNGNYCRVQANKEYSLSKVYVTGGKQHSTMVSIFAAPGLDSQRSPKNFIGKIVDVADVNLWRCLEKSGQWLENVDQTHLVLASCKLVIQKTVTGC